MFDLVHHAPLPPVIPGRDAVPLPDARSIRRLGAGFCARHAVLPLRAVGGVQPVAVADPERFALVSGRIRGVLGDIVPLPADRAEVAAAIARHAGLALSREAEARCPPDRSCRNVRIAPVAAIGVLGLLALAICLMPGRALIAGQLAAITLLAIQTALYLVAMLPRRIGRAIRTVPTDLPVISLFLPLYREEDIAPMLLERIAALEYPRDRLEVWLIMECDDSVTARAIARVALPDWAHVLTVAPGEIQTKPRAMNVALDFCRGSIVGVYDAEDAPAPDQLLRVAARFAAAKPNVAALQGTVEFLQYPRQLANPVLLHRLRRMVLDDPARNRTARLAHTSWGNDDLHAPRGAGERWRMGCPQRDRGRRSGPSPGSRGLADRAD